MISNMTNFQFISILYIKGFIIRVQQRVATAKPRTYVASCSKLAWLFK